ncbi:MAG: enoyl-CoA hydratase [Rhodobacteraceae bacterium]|nr:enoyl-CoA hydratase [Paracoccaceae bacterium]
MSDLLVEVSDGIATLTLNRPHALNALNGVLRRALVEALAAMDARDDVRVIVLTGTGRAFCAGLDVRELEGSDADVSANVADTDIGAAISALRTPIIAAINGLAVTGGFEITLACDIVVAAESAWFQDTHAKIGLMPGWGLSQRLQRTIGPAAAKEISLTARRVTADEAMRLGFVARVSPDAGLAAEARALAADIARWDGETLRNIKHLIVAGGVLPLGEALDFERETSRALNARVQLGSGRDGARPAGTANAQEDDVKGSWSG